MPKGYHQLTYDLRCQIFILKDRGDSNRSIALALNVNHTTIGRELKRNCGKTGYRYKQAQKKADSRRMSSPNKKMTGDVVALIEEKLRLQWSPVQISGWLKKHNIVCVSHEIIYQHVWRDKKNGGSLYQELRHRGKKYNKRSKGKAGRGCIPNRIDIEERPSIVEEKTRVGDWELDSIIGAGQQGAIVSMVDRASKLTQLKKVKQKTSENVGQAIVTKLKTGKFVALTCTSDNGKEFANHEYVSRELGVDFYFAKPYHSWERGLNEHTNGLVRQYFPKKQTFDEISDEEIEKVEHLLNNRPRKILNFETPIEAYQRLTNQSNFKQ